MYTGFDVSCISDFTNSHSLRATDEGKSIMEESLEDSCLDCARVPSELGDFSVSSSFHHSNKEYFNFSHSMLFTFASPRNESHENFRDLRQ